MENSLQYFGTPLNNAGHSFYVLRDGVFSGVKSWYEQMVRTIGFCPESLPQNCTKLGQHEFHQIGEYSILAILGSCYDERGGSKSVFFIRSLITEEELIDIIKENKAAMAIINKMKFIVPVIPQTV